MSERKRRNVLIMSLGHLVNDMYMNQLQIMLPFFVIAGISLRRGSFLISIFTIASSFVQPVFGYISDKKSNPDLVFLGTLWMSILLGLTGLTTNYLSLIAIVAFAGLGTAAFHPQASALVATFSGGRKTFMQAIFIASGNVGWALTPLLAVPLLQKSGLKITPIFMIPGILISILLWIITKNVTIQKTNKNYSTGTLVTLKKNWFELSKIMVIVTLRSLTYSSLIAFLPIYLFQKGISYTTSSKYLFLMLFAGSIGGLIGGFLADKYGKKVVAIVSLVITSPLFYLFLTTDGYLRILFLLLAGAFLLATFSITVALAHQVIKNNAGLASGLMLGLGTGMGGLGVGIMGILTEYYGITFTINLLIWLPLLAGLSGFALRENSLKGSQA